MEDDKSTNASSTDDDAILPDDTEQTVPTPDEPIVADEPETEAEDEDEPTEAPAEEEAPEESEQEEPDEEQLKKQRNDEAARKRIEDKRQREAERRQQQEAYVSEAEDLKDQAIRQLQVEAYNTRVENTERSFVDGFEKALSNIDFFKSGTPAASKALEKTLEDYAQSQVLWDENGNAVGHKTDIYKYLQDKASLYEELTHVGSVKGKQAESRMRAVAETPPAKATQEKVTKDAFEKGFDEDL